jgi:hypothetical protein
MTGRYEGPDDQLEQELVPEKSFRTNMERNDAAKQRIVGGRFKYCRSLSIIENYCLFALFLFQRMFA